jgi:hypothetical protein
MTKRTDTSAKSDHDLENVHQACVVRALKRLEREGFDLSCAGDQNAAKRGRQAQAVAAMTGLRNGEPDLRVYLADGRIELFELKINGNYLSQDQKDRHERLSALGHEVHVTRHKYALDSALEIVGIVATAMGLALSKDHEYFEKVARESTDEVMKAIGGNRK